MRAATCLLVGTVKRATGVCCDGIAASSWKVGLRDMYIEVQVIVRLWLLLESSVIKLYIESIHVLYGCTARYSK